MAVYRALLGHTIVQARLSKLPMEVRYDGAEAVDFAAMLGDDIAYARQAEGDLGARMAAVPPPCILIGSDAPDVTPSLLREAARALTDAPAVIGPANDGGYWLLGLAEPMPFLFEDMEWSTDAVLPETLRRLEARGIAPAMLPELTDVDTGEDLARYPQFDPRVS